MTQAELAEMTDLTDGYISRVERGQKQIGMQAFLRILQVLGSGIEGLVTATQKESGQMDIFLNRCKVIMADCSDTEKKLLVDMLESMKDVIRGNQYEIHQSVENISQQIS
ncbi:MAG: helix-turn-helix transcriptional regulator [Lachnospiraceae bacterium]|nr:helix-turn-helix transcriptional regulator [Lachnospiraceae bacterium]